MLFLVVLVVTTLVAAATTALRRRFSVRDSARIGLALAMAVAGLTHWVNPDPFVQHLPDWVPGRSELVAVTGALEIGIGLALLLWRRRELAGLVTAAYLVAVFPANVYVAVAGVDVDGQPDGAYAWVRLPLQALFVGWAFWSTRSPYAEHSRTDEGPSQMTCLDVATVEPVEVAPGISRRTLTETEHARAWLIDFAPGTTWPEVDVHDTEERYYVLSGEVLEGDHVHGPGSYVTFAAGSRHRPSSVIGAQMLGINLAR